MYIYIYMYIPVYTYIYIYMHLYIYTYVYVNTYFYFLRISLMMGLGISRTNADSQWNPVYKYCIEFVVVETKRFVSSNVNVILTRQTCSQRSSMSAESKRRALENCFYERICHMFQISKCGGDWNLGLYTSWVLAKRKSLRNAKFRFFLRAKHVFFRKSPLRSGSLFASTQKVHRPKSQSPLHFDIGNMRQIRS